MLFLQPFSLLFMLIAFACLCYEDGRGIFGAYFVIILLIYPIVMGEIWARTPPLCQPIEVTYPSFYKECINRTLEYGVGGWFCTVNTTTCDYRNFTHV
jgi:hypothetical protein